MDLFDKEFDPTDEYEAIETQLPQQPPKQPSQQTQPHTAEFDNNTCNAQNIETTAAIPQNYQQPQPMYGNINMPVYPYYPAQPHTPRTQNVYPVQNNVPPYAPYQAYAPYPHQMPQQPMYHQANTPPVMTQSTPQPQNQPQRTPQVLNPYANSYNANTPQAPNPEKKKTPLKAKIFMLSMLFLLLAFAVAIVALVLEINRQNTKENNNYNNSPQIIIPPDEDTDNTDDVFAYDFPSGQLTEIEFDITLQADEGQSQAAVSNSTDKNTYKADKDAKEISASDPPKDKDDSKYTAQTAYKTVTDSVVSIECYETKITYNEYDVISSGTGTIITADGYIVTNSHVILNSNDYAINVILSNSKEYPAKVVGFDTRTDLAVIKIEAKDLSYAKFANSENVNVGEDIIAIGNPGGTSFQNSLTKGIVSAVERDLDIDSIVKYIQIDAAINPGNSGGPLCNMYGQVIGINTAKISSVVYEGMGFAIPSNTVLEIANDLIRYGYVQGRVRLGITGLEVTDDVQQQYGLPNGIIISEIDKSGPMGNTQAQPDDIITAINGKPISNFADIFKELENYKDGDTVTITIERVQ